MAGDPSVPSPSNSGPTNTEHGVVNAIVKAFLESNLSLVLIILAAAVGITALMITPREEDPQIVVPLADIFVSFPGHSAEEVEQLVSTPLEKLLYQIDGVEYVYSMSKRDRAIITVRYYVGQDRERSLVKLYKRIDENLDRVPPGVTGWVIKPVEIDDVPIVTLTLASESAGEYALRRVAEEVVDRLATVENLSRAYVLGGQQRIVHVYVDPDRMQGYSVSPLEIERAIGATNLTRTAGTFDRSDTVYRVEVGEAFRSARELRELVVGVFDKRPVFLKDVADVVDGPDEVTNYVRHGWGPARGFSSHDQAPGTVIGGAIAPGAGVPTTQAAEDAPVSRTAVTIALAKKRGTNAVWVAESLIDKAGELRERIVPDNMEMIITRNYGLTADEKVDGLVEALGVAIFIIIALLVLTLGLREALIVAVAVPVVFGLTLAVNLLFGYTINRVTLFALILSLGLLVDDPIVDVENISRHFAMRGRGTRRIVLEAVAEIRPPLIAATLAVIVSFLPMFFITGMMGPYMRPMALNVPVTMIMSMLVAFTITPWMGYHILKNRYNRPDGGPALNDNESYDAEAIQQSPLYKLFYPVMAPLLRGRWRGGVFLLVIFALFLATASLAAVRAVPLKMLPFDNKNELLLVLDFDEGTTLERSDAAVREFETYLSGVPEVTGFTSYVGLASPMDFNGLVRHYYLRQGPNVAEIRVDLVGKKSRRQQSHAIGLRLRDELTAIADKHNAVLSIVEIPPGPPVIATLTAEVMGQADHTYEDLIAASRVVRARFKAEPGVVDVDDSVEADWQKFVFVTDKEKAALNGVSVEDIAGTVKLGLEGETAGTIRDPHERNPLLIELRLRRPLRSSAADLAKIYVKGRHGQSVPLAELGTWREATADKTIYHKNLRRVVYVFSEVAGRPPAEAVVDIQADQVVAEHKGSSRPAARRLGNGWIDKGEPRPLSERTFFSNGSGIAWHVPEDIDVRFSGEGEWQITLDVFRDLGLAFAAAMIGIYILLVAQTASFAIPVIVMLAIPLTVLGIMPGFWLLNVLVGDTVGGYGDPVFFTATGMIGMIALAGIVTRDSIILVDFIHLSLKRGRSLFDAIMESRVVRLRPILLTSITAMLSAAPITIDPIFSGLAWALIFGLFAADVFALFVIPIVYWLLYKDTPGHGLPQTQMEE